MWVSHTNNGHSYGSNTTMIQCSNAFPRNTTIERMNGIVAIFVTAFHYPQVFTPFRTETVSLDLPKQTGFKYHPHIHTHAHTKIQINSTITKI